MKNLELQLVDYKNINLTLVRILGMTDFQITYKFREDKEAIKRLQAVSSDPKSNYGLKVENGLLVGTKEWFLATEDGRLPKETLTGRISKVYMSGHNDCHFLLSSKSINLLYFQFRIQASHCDQTYKL